MMLHCNWRKATAIMLLICTNKIIYSQSIPKLRIDPAYAYGGSLKDYFSGIEYIPLETNKESLFGDINDIIFTDSSLVITDYDTYSVLFFSPQGKFLNKLKGNATSYPNVYFNKRTGIIRIIADYRYPYPAKMYFKNYSLTGKELNSGFLTPEDMKSYYARGYSFGSGYSADIPNYSVQDGEKLKDRTCFLVNTYKGDSLYKAMLPYKTMEHKLLFKQLGGAFPTYESDSLYVTIPYEHILYKVNKDTAIPLYQFVFTADRSLPKEIVNATDDRVVDSVLNALNHDRNIIIRISRAIFHNNLLYFKVDCSNYNSTRGSLPSDQYNFMYDVSANRLASIERQAFDSSNYYLPVTSLRARILGLDYFKGSLYTHVSSLQMFEAMEAAKNKHPKYPPVLQQYFATQNRKSNPVLVRMRFKE